MASTAPSDTMDVGELVQLYVYDLSGGMARAYSQMLLGRQIEAIYHTSIVVSGLEHFFGGGIKQAPAGQTPFGQPLQVLALGRTQIPEDVRAELLAGLSERYTPESYSLFHNNCNSFSDELAQLLCGAGIPQHITGLPAEVLATPFGQMIAPMLTGLEHQLRDMQAQAVWPHAAEPTAEAAEEPSEAIEAAVPATAQGQAHASSGTAAAAPLPEPVTEQGTEGPAVVAAEVEIEAAVAAGMMREAEQQQQQRGAVGATGTPVAGTAAVQAGTVQAGADQDAKLALELAVQAEFNRLMATGAVGEHEAQALALEAVAVQQSLDEQWSRSRSSSERRPVTE